MRELKDYFCNFEQTQDLIKLGLSEKYGISAEQYETAEFGYSGFLRSQALDYFMDLGYKAIKPMYNVYFKYHWFRFDYNNNKYHTKKLPTYHEAESALIDKLIELEKEARNGK